MLKMDNVKYVESTQIELDNWEAPEYNKADFGKGIDQGKSIKPFETTFKARAGASAKVNMSSGLFKIAFDSCPTFSRQSLREFIEFLIKIEKEY